jgi:hypothetical protein
VPSLEGEATSFVSKDVENGHMIVKNRNNELSQADKFKEAVRDLLYAEDEAS